MNGRERLPDRRGCQTFNLRIGAAEFSVTVGLYAGGQVGEVFVAGAKVGSDMDAVTRDAAILLSLALQHGVPRETIKGALTRESSGVASSVIGAIVDRLDILEVPL
jgi:ribonucleoside-diphosphate reductase alpha chain